MENNNLKDKMDNPWQTLFYLIDKFFLTSIILLFHYSTSRPKSGVQENDCICINLYNYNEVLWNYFVYTAFHNNVPKYGSAA
jgi:hypothetical protein